MVDKGIQFIERKRGGISVYMVANGTSKFFEGDSIQWYDGSSIV
jgi:hypothetical protein